MARRNPPVEPANPAPRVASAAIRLVVVPRGSRRRLRVRAAIVTPVLQIPRVAESLRIARLRGSARLAASFRMRTRRFPPATDGILRHTMGEAAGLSDDDENGGDERDDFHILHSQTKPGARVCFCKKNDRADAPSAREPLI